MVIADVEPVAGFLASLDPRLRAKVYRGIDLLANNWPLIGEPHVRHVTGHTGLWELREALGNVNPEGVFLPACRWYACDGSRFCQEEP